MKKQIILILAVLWIIANWGCQQSRPQSIPLSDAEKLFAYKNPYIGNHVADSRLLEALQLRHQLGNYSIELQTDKTPYKLIVHFTEPPQHPQIFDASMQTNALLLLALIDNAHIIEWTYPPDNQTPQSHIQQSFSITDAARIVQNDIKNYGKSVDQLQILLAQHAPNLCEF